MKTLQTYGWSTERIDAWDNEALKGFVPARIIADFGHRYKVAMPDEISAQLSGALAHKLTATDMPKIGDWVAIEMADDMTAVVQHVLPRTSEIARGHVGATLDKQVVAANVDVAFIMQPLDHDFSVERLERYLFQLSIQGIEPIILLNKSDKARDIEEKQALLSDLGAKVLTISALYDEDLSAIEQYISVGKTAVIIGSSGAGKSTLTNKLLGEDRQVTQEIRERDSKGRHTTVHRELFVLPGGGMIIDTPGIRELQLWGSIDDLSASFPEITDAIARCHYPNCSHITEDRCAVQAGLADGTISPKRYKIYLNFKKELQSLVNKQGVIEGRRSQKTRESAKRRRDRSLRNAIDKDQLD